MCVVRPQWMPLRTPRPCPVSGASSTVLARSSSMSASCSSTTVKIHDQVTVPLHLNVAEFYVPEAPTEGDPSYILYAVVVRQRTLPPHGRIV